MSQYNSPEKGDVFQLSFDENALDIFSASPWPSPSPYNSYMLDPSGGYFTIIEKESAEVLDVTHDFDENLDILDIVEDDEGKDSGEGANNRSSPIQSEEIDDTAPSKNHKNKTLFLLVCIMLAIVETVSNVLVTINYYTKERQTYFWISVCILVFAISFRLSLMLTSLPFFRFGQLAESLPELILQACVFLREVKDMRSSSWTWIVSIASLAISILIIIFGITQTYFSWETLMTRLMIAFYFLFISGARILLIATLFFEFRYFVGFLYICVTFIIRLKLLTHFRIFELSKMNHFSSFICLTVMLCVLSIMPFGSAEIDVSRLEMEGLDPFGGLKMTFGFTGAAVRSFRRRLANDFAITLLFITNAETLTIILITALFTAFKPPELSQTNGLNMLVVCWYIFFLLVLAGIFYYLAFRRVKSNESEYVLTIDLAAKAAFGPEGRKRNMLLDAINRRHSPWNNVLAKQVRGDSGIIAYVPALLYFCYMNYSSEVDNLDSLMEKLDFQIWGDSEFEKINRLKPGGLKLSHGDVKEDDLIQVREIVLHAIKSDNVRPKLRLALRCLKAELKVRDTSQASDDNNIVDVSEISSIEID